MIHDSERGTEWVRGWDPDQWWRGWPVIEGLTHASQQEGRTGEAIANGRAR